MHRPILRAAVAAVHLVFLALLACNDTAVERGRSIDVAVEFRSLWWSLEQMESFDPNSPPPKETEIVLEKWEYSDPVGVPHPNSVDAVAILTNLGSQAYESLEVSSTTRWKVGPIANEPAARWGDAEFMPSASDPVSLAPGEMVEVRVFTAEIRKLQDELKYRDEWPWACEVEVLIQTSDGADSTVARMAAVLPILAGD